MNPVSFIATRIYSNLNEDDIYSTMIMFVTSFSETCLPVIKNEFEKMYGISMKEYILVSDSNDQYWLEVNVWLS